MTKSKDIFLISLVSLVLTAMNVGIVRLLYNWPDPITLIITTICIDLYLGYRLSRVNKVIRKPWEIIIGNALLVAGILSIILVIILIAYISIIWPERKYS